MGFFGKLDELSRRGHESRFGPNSSQPPAWVLALLAFVFLTVFVVFFVFLAFSHLPSWFRSQSARSGHTRGLRPHHMVSAAFGFRGFYPPPTQFRL